MSDSTNTNQWGILGLAGMLSLCCVGTAVLTGGAVLAGGSVAGATVVNGGVGGIGGVIVTGLASALPLVAIGIGFRYRISRSR